MMSNKKNAPLTLTFLFLLFIFIVSGCLPNAQEAGPAETPSPAPAVKEGLSPQIVQNGVSDYIKAPCFSESFFKQNNIVLKDHVVKNYSNEEESLVINFDADVYMPDAQSFPAVKFEFRFFTQDEVDAIVDAFTGGEPLYKSGTSSGSLADTDICSGTQRWLAGTYTLNETLDAKLHILNDPNDMSARVAMYAEDKETGEPLILYSRDWRDYDVYDVSGQPEGIGMSPEEAMEAADIFFRRLGLDDEVKISRMGLLVTKNVTCYEIKFLRYIDDIPFIYVNTPISAHEKINFLETPRMPEEGMTVYINDSGILKLDWNSPLTRLETIDDNAALKSAEDIADDFVTQMHSVFASDGCFRDYDIEIMCLNYGLAHIPDSNGQFQAVPVWDFFGSSTERCSDVMMFLANSFGFVGQIDSGFMTINAVSGGLFNRDTGY